MNRKHTRQNGYALLTAAIWGTAFVAQSVAADYLDAFSFNAARASVAFLFLLLFCMLRRWIRRAKGTDAGMTAQGKKDLLWGGLCCGAFLSVASTLQQKGIETTSAGKSGFITALYIIIVPICGIFLKKKAPRTIWLSVALAVVGLYCLCMKGDFSLSEGDFYLLLCAVCFSGQILCVDHFSEKVDGAALSCVQFLVMAVLCSAGMLMNGLPSREAVQPCLGAILYAGVFSSGVAYTLQILAQRGSNPTVVSLLMSMEAVFATIAGALILHDRMSGREYLGCVLMLAAVILAQLPDRKAPQAAACPAESGEN